MSKGGRAVSGKQEIPHKTRVENTLVGRSLQEGTYQVEAVIGHGGMGEVFLASHRALDVPVALKQGRADQSSAGKRHHRT